jgi:hypothetical protein
MQPNTSTRVPCGLPVQGDDRPALVGAAEPDRVDVASAAADERDRAGELPVEQQRGAQAVQVVEPDRVGV